ncbi:DUF1801 domain-containing protein [soil metagenome]
MQSSAKNVKDYLKEIPEDRKEGFSKLRDTILKNLPKGFEEGMTYGMIGYYIPHSIYPPGYHVTPELPLGVVSIASQKNFIALYHMGLYGDPKLLEWFKKEYAANSKTKLDMGKSCVRFKKPDQIPFTLIGELIKKVSVKEFIAQYEKNLAALKKK